MAHTIVPLETEAMQRRAILVIRKEFRYAGAIEMFNEVDPMESNLNTHECMHPLPHNKVSILFNEGSNPNRIQVWVGNTLIEKTINSYGYLFPFAKHARSAILEHSVTKQNSNIGREIAN